MSVHALIDVDHDGYGYIGGGSCLSVHPSYEEAMAAKGAIQDKVDESWRAFNAYLDQYIGSLPERPKGYECWKAFVKSFDIWGPSGILPQKFDRGLRHALRDGYKTQAYGYSPPAVDRRNMGNLIIVEIPGVQRSGNDRVCL
jgi:hypothetical protein